MCLKKNALEWSVFGVSLLLVLGVLGFLGREVWSGAPTPANLRARVTQLEKIGGKTIATIQIQNAGRTTARGVEVEVGFEKQKANFTLDYVPREGSKEGFAVFVGQPTKEKIVARVLGFS